MGCTVCHEGNGHGLNVSDAHGADKFWNKPLYKKDFIEIGCAKCHPSPYLKETPLLSEGRKLFMTKACYGCHKNDGVSSGKLGVDLSFVGTKWPIEYIMTKIEKPRVSIPESIMPAITMTKEERKALTVYLKSLTGENLVIGPVTNYVALEKWTAEKPVEVPVNIASGENVFKGRACNACHIINGTGGKVGPNLSVYGLQRTIDWMIQHHIDPRSLVGGSRMPDFKFSNSELKALSLYLSSLEDKNRFEVKK
jgi:mono/diheme cytochrome c family protein